VRSGERYTTVALDGLGNDLAARALDDEIVELFVHFTVAGFVGFPEVALREDLVAFAQVFVERLKQATRRAMFGERACGEAFEHTANIDLVHDLLRRDCSNQESARTQLG
jgi:hypothetical protein